MLEIYASSVYQDLEGRRTETSIKNKWTDRNHVIERVSGVSMEMQLKWS